MARAGFTTAWYANWQARLNTPPHRRQGGQDEPPGVEREIAGLHDPIIAECKRRGWKYVHSDPTRRTTIGEGVCDFIIYADRGRMFHVECKRKGGKLSLEQQAFIAWVGKLGHTVHVITTMTEFMAIVGEKPFVGDSDHEKDDRIL